MQATEVLAELLKSTNPQATASKYLDHLSEEFFMVASTYLEMVHNCIVLYYLLNPRVLRNPVICVKP